MSTPHINAQLNDFAETVLMPGDPLRAKHIAETFLDDAREVTSVRNILGYTGTYNDKPVSIMASGMGIPSMSIYARELIVSYGVKNLIRIGTCGAISTDVKVRDIVIAMGACTDSKVNQMRYKNYDFAATANYDLLATMVETAKECNVKVRVGNVHTADLFYSPDADMFDVMENMGVLAVEMETAGLYGVAHEYGVNALSVVTVSDHIRTGEQTSPEERQTSFNEMLETALEAAIKL